MLFRIPIIFEGDLAKTAARYIKKDDLIHVSGKLFIDSPPPNMTYAQSNVQVSFKALVFKILLRGKCLKVMRICDESIVFDSFFLSYVFVFSLNLCE